jgi:hypothetical protein
MYFRTIQIEYYSRQDLTVSIFECGKCTYEDAVNRFVQNLDGIVIDVTCSSHMLDYNPELELTLL